MPAKIVLIQVLIMTCIICYYFVFNGIVAEEKDIVESIKPGHQIIQAQSDNRRNNVFYSTPEFYYALKNSMPSISILMETEAAIEYKIQERDKLKILKRTVNILLVDDKFFSMVKGNLISGETISEDDFQSGRPIAIMTQGLQGDLYPDGESGQEVSINGTSFLVKGIWAQSSAKTKENYSLILPISAINILGIADKTYINRFILKGYGSRELEQLKIAIDNIQLNAGYTPVRPEYTILNLKMSERYLSIISNQKVYLDVSIWILSLIAAVLFFQDFRNRFYIFNDWIQFRLMSRHSRERIEKELTRLLSIFISIITGISVILSSVILSLLFFIFKTPVKVGTHFHLAIFIIIFLYLYLFIEMRRYIKNYEMKISSN